MKPNYILSLFFSTLFVGLSLLSCTKSHDPVNEVLPVYTDTGFDKHTVYMAGYYLDSSKTERAAYWVNGKMTLLDKYSSVATGIAVDGTDVYLSGYTYSVGLRNVRMYEAVYWKNGVEFPLKTNFPSGNAGMLASGIAVSNGIVYIVGDDQGHATLWKNGVPNTLETNSSAATALCIAGTDVYVAGLTWKQTACCSIRMATLWKNGIPVSLGLGDSQALSVFVKDKDVFVGGYDDPNPFGVGGHLASAAYWKNGSLVKLDSMNFSSVQAIAFDGNDLYAAGNTAIWKNNVPVFLNQGGVTNCTSLFLKDGEIFVAGCSIGGPNTGNASVTLWHNNHPYNFPYDGSAKAIFVK